MMMTMMMMTILTSIPDPGTIEPLDHKLPKDIGSEGADFTLKCLDKVEMRVISADSWICVFVNFPGGGGTVLAPAVAQLGR